MFGFGKKEDDEPIDPHWEIFVSPDWIERESYDHKGIRVTISEPGWSWYARCQSLQHWGLGPASSEQEALAGALYYVETKRDG